MLIVAVAADDPTQHHILTDAQRCLSVRNEAQTSLEDTDTVLLAVLVVHHRRQQAGQQRQTHGGHFAGDWAWQNQRFFTRMNQLLNLRVHEAVGDHFLIAFIVQHGFHTLERQIGFFMAAHYQTGLYRLVRDAVIAINARHFFDQVFFDFHVETPAWRNRLPLVVTDRNFTAQASQNIGHLIISNVMTNQAIQLAAAQCDGRTLRQRGFMSHIDDWTRFAAAQFDQQRGSALDCFVLQRRINATLVAVRSIGVQAMTARTAGDGQRAEESRFQQHVLGFVIHARVLAAKDTGHRQRFVVVGNHQGVCTEFGFRTVQQDQGFALFRHPHFDAAFDAIFIERMHWLTQFQQDIVSHINDRINGANTAATQFLFHPQRRWRFDVDALHHAAQIARAGVGGFNFDWQHVRDGRRHWRDFRRVQRQLVQYRHVASHADDA